jgi:phenylpropionate dioxygenase-like ring-hydroxylating dioxygenase large terminal subunit
LSAARGLPAGWYRDPAQAAREADTIFARHWLFVCHVSDLPSPGTAARFDCAGRSLFVLRTGDGGLRAFRNACAHRAMRLVEGDAHTGLAFCLDARVRCPYHGWTYDDAGVRLDACPDHGAVDAVVGARGASLHPAHVESWRGLVFAAFEAPHRTLAETLAPVARDWPDISSMRRIGDPLLRPLAADWKLACQHLLDATHLVPPARAPWQLFGAPRYDAAGGAGGAGGASGAGGAGALAGSAELEVGDAAAWPARAYRRLIGALQSAPAREDWLFVWPSLLLTRAPDGLRAQQVIAAGAGASLLREVRYGAVDGSRAMRRLRYARERVARRWRLQAASLLERAQRGRAALDPDETLPDEACEPGLAWFAERCLDAHERAAAEGKPAPRKPRRRRTSTVPA